MLELHQTHPDAVSYTNQVGLRLMLHLDLVAGLHNWAHNNGSHLIHSIVDVNTLEGCVEEAIHVAAEEIVGLLVSELLGRGGLAHHLVEGLAPEAAAVEIVVRSVGLHAKVKFLEDVHSIHKEVLRDPVHQSEGVLKDVSHLEKLAQVRWHILAVLGEHRDLADHGCDGFEALPHGFESLLSEVSNCNLDISLDDLDISHTTVEIMKLSLHDASK